MSIFFALAGSAVLAALYLKWVSPGRVLVSLGARPIDQSPVLKNVKNRMEEISRQRRLAPPKLWVLPEFTPNALILRSSPRRLHIALTEGLVRALSAEELDSALSLCIAHGHQPGRLRQTWAAMVLYPFTRLLQAYPLPAQILLSPWLAFFLRATVRSGRFLKSDREAARLSSPLLIAAVLQKLSVMGGKIPLRNWNIALDSLFLLSPLALDQSPFWVFFAQPSVDCRRRSLLEGMACETRPSLT